mgnify:FL=1
MKITKATLKRLIKEELDTMQEESNPFGSYRDKLEDDPRRPAEEYTAMAERVIERSRRYYPKLISACDQDALLKETAGYLAYTDQPGMGPNFRMGPEGVREVPTSVFEAALRA